MWDSIDAAVGAAREREVKESDVFFRPVLEKGVRMVRHDSTLENAYCVIREIIGFQFVETDAVQDVKAELEALRSSIQKLLAEKDAKYREEIQELRSSMWDVHDEQEKIQAEAD